MTKIYVVTCGEYSDYGIDAMFTTKELAEKYIYGQADHHPKAWEKESDYRIEEYELDEVHPPVHYLTEYRAKIWLKDGALAEESDSRVKERDGQRGYHFTYGEAEAVQKTFSFGGTYIDPPGQSMGVSYKSAKHAMKLAVEGRQGWLRGVPNRTTQYEVEI